MKQSSPSSLAARRPPWQLASVYLVSGDEPLLVNEVVDALRAAAVASGCEERESHVVERSFSWDDVTASLRNLSLFSAGKLVEIRLPTADARRRGLPRPCASSPAGHRTATPW